MTTYQEFEYQKLESEKFLVDHVEKDYRRGQFRKKLVDDLWRVAALYSVAVVAGFAFLQLVGVEVTDILQTGVNAFVDWSIS